MNTRHRPLILLIVCLLPIVGLALYGPIAQFANYHAFADQRSWAGLPHAADVLSNLGFALTGLLGLVHLWRLDEQQLRERGLEHSWLGYSMFFLAITLTACGSSWYHLQPDNARLVWDRLPIAIACVGLVDAVFSERLSPRLMAVLRPLLMLMAPVSVLWWRLGDLATGTGNLAPYLYVQGLPMLAIPAAFLLYGVRRGDLRAYGWGMLAYALAKILELADHRVYEFTGWLSGHTLKHVLAALAAVAIYRLLVQRRNEVKVE